MNLRNLFIDSNNLQTFGIQHSTKVVYRLFWRMHIMNALLMDMKNLEPGIRNFKFTC